MANGTCSIEGCDRPAKTRGWCKRHYERWRTGLPLLGTTGELRRKPRHPCSVEGCDRVPRYAATMCDAHARRLRMYGDPLGGKRRFDARGTILERCWQKIEVHVDGCWLWTGTIDSRGYGRIAVKPQLKQAHRVMWEFLVGPIPEGLTIDHLCRVRHCVRPDHLETVTMGVNVLRGTSPWARNARKTHCPQGHPYEGKNLYVNKRGGRICRACARAATRRYYYAK